MKTAPAAIEAGSLTSAAAAAEMFDRYPVYRQAMQWLEQFVARAHPDLGRSGAICPRLAPALRADTVWLAAVSLDGATLSHAIAAGRLLRDLFHDLATGAHRPSSALLGFFPSLPATDAAQFIDEGHRVLKPELIEQGLMLGEFHPTSTVGSVHNRELPVMRCPVPMFAVRVMTTHDLLFADQPGTSPADRLRFLLAYQRHIGPRLPATARDDLKARIDAARQVLYQGV